MREPVQISPHAIYDDGQLRLALGVTSATLTRERKQGRLRYTRKGNRLFYLGRWVIDWMESDPKPAREVSNA